MRHHLLRVNIIMMNICCCTLCSMYSFNAHSVGNLQLHGHSQADKLELQKSRLDPLKSYRSANTCPPLPNHSRSVKFLLKD